MTNTSACVKTVLLPRRVAMKVRRPLPSSHPSLDRDAFQHDWIHVHRTIHAAMADVFPTSEVVFSANAEQVGLAVDVIKVIDGVC